MKDEQQPNFFSQWIKRMDNDIAARFVLSGISLDVNKLVIACQEMEMRYRNKVDEIRKKIVRATPA